MKSTSAKSFCLALLRITRDAGAFQCVPLSCSTRSTQQIFGATLHSRRTSAIHEPLNSPNSRRRVSAKRDMLADPTLLLDHVVSYLPTLSLTLGDPIVDLAQSRPSPTMEAEILSNMSHVALDLFGFLNPERLLLRLATLLGRIMFMTAEYDVDQQISIEEMLFQGGMLTLSATQFASSWQQMQGSLTQRYGDVSFRDQVVYQVFFSPVGVSWLQFRSLASSCIEWVEVQPDQKLSTINEESGDQVAYWLYNGHVTTRHSAGSPLVQEMHHRRGKPVVRDMSSGDNEKVDYGKATSKSFGLLAGPGALSALVDLGAEDEHASGAAAGESLHLTVGEKGATMMQINLGKLKKLMDDDDKLDKTVRNLVLLSMQSTLKSMLAAVSNGTTSPSAQTP